MSQILTNNKHYSDIANTIRQMKEVNTTYKPREMASALKDIYSNEVEGTLPLSFQANGNDLLNYRIDGASGGVGARTNNLFDILTITTRKYINASGEEKSSTAENFWNYLNHSDYINISPSQNYTFKCVLTSRYLLNNTMAFCWFDINKNIISRNTFNINQTIDNYVISNTSPGNATYLIINFIGLVDGAKFNLNVGSTSLPYEPYGYKVPVKINNTNVSTIYLDSPLYENESISLSDTEVDIPTIEGTNTLTIDTTVQPSNVYIQAPKDHDEIVYLTTILEEEI